MSGAQVLAGKTAIVYGGGGWVGGAVARAYSDAGATVYLAGRGRESLDRAATGLLAGAAAGTAVVEAGESGAVEAHMHGVMQETGRIDVVFNALAYDDVQGQSLADLDGAVFVDRIHRAAAMHHSVARAAARHMVKAGTGLLSAITGHGQPWPGMGTTAVCWGLIEAMLRQWAADLGPRGVRVAWLRTGGFRESVMGQREAGPGYAGDAEQDDVVASLREATMLKALPSLAEAGRAAVYLAAADGITACAVNLTAGALSD